MTVSHHLRKVTHAAQEGIGDTRRAAAAKRNLFRRFRLDIHLQDARAALDDLDQVGRIVVFQPLGNAETRAERSCKQTGARRGTHQSERIQGNPHGTGSGPLVYHDIDDVVLHRGIEIFLHFRGEPVYLVDEEDVSRLQGSQQTGQVAGTVQDGTGRYFHVDPHLVGDDVRQRCFSQARRAMEKRMVQRLPAHLGCLDIDAQTGHDFSLSGEIFQLLGPDNSVQFLIFAVVCVMRVEFLHTRGFTFRIQIYFFYFENLIFIYCLLKCL